MFTLGVQNRKGEYQMKRMKQRKILRSVVVAAVAVTLLAGAFAAPRVGAAGHQASYVKDLGQTVNVNYLDQLDSSVVHKLPDFVRDDEQISVIVTVDSASLMDLYDQTDKTMSFSSFAQSRGDEDIASSVTADREKLLDALDAQNVSYKLGDRYTTLLTGYELEIRAGDFAKVCSLLGEGEDIIVSEVYKTAETQLVENVVNVYDTGIFKSGDSGYDGSGMVVAVLDTGLDSKHTAFSLDNFTSDHLGMTYEDVAAVLDQTKANEQAGGLGIDDVYINEKVPFGYDYADNDPDVYSTHNNHGTHVSGVIVGKDDVITGVAPNAQLVAMKVFSDVMDTARASWILSALEDCVVLGVDVINMSLGTACGFSRETDEEAISGVYEKIREAGISLVVAASNSFNSSYGSEKNGNLPLTSNPDSATVGSPGTYDGAMSVASINGKETPYIKHKDTIIYFEETTNGASKENDFFQTLLGDKDSVDYEYVIIPGVGRSADYTGLDLKGKIALVRRGSNTFEEKAIIAEAQGAAGIIIYNNVSGDIKMNVGDATLAACSISQDDGEMLVAAGNGKLKISSDQSSGPFISDFSSWGPTPSLGIKPEITAHGGNILSSITGGGYDRISGTSMACPNLAGVVVLLRQYVVENFPEIAEDNVQVTRMVNRLMMSTADIALNTNGLPYAVRKQGAGLANLMASIQTPAYITTYDADGKEMDKTKIELGDDAEKTGVYTMNFTVTNFGDKKVAYDIGAYVLTEGVSETKTNAGQTTVTEEAYVLDGASIEVTSQENLKGNKLTVDAGSSADVTVTVTLSDADKAYLDESFANGMYVEGYITLKATRGTDVDLNVPYLAFYGDWTVAPLFDLDYFETDADEQDDAIPVEDKNLADAYSTRPVGGLYDDFVSYLGSYYFIQDPEDILISANPEYVALSNREGSVHSLRFVWAGLLRNASKIEIQIVNDTTGEVVFETVDTDVRKSYGDGGPIYPANIEIEFDTQDYDLANNSQYTVTLTGYLDYEDGGVETNKKAHFQFPLTVDFEAPTVTGVDFSYEYDKTLEKNRLYADIQIYDNHYAMCAQVGYVGNGTDEDGSEIAELKSFEQHMVPVYSKRNSTTTVRYELTDYIYQIKEGSLNDMAFAVTCYDYAMNYATFEIGLPNDFADFYFDSLEGGVTLSPNEVYALEPLVYPTTEWCELLEFTSSRPGVVRVVNNKLVAVKSGNAVIKARDPATNQSVTFPVTVLSEGDEGYRRYDKPVADLFRLDGYKTQKAYYVVDNEEKDIGDTGDVRFFEGNYSLSMYPSETVLLNYTLDPYFPNDTSVEFESSNENIVKIDGYGNVTAVAEGFASVTIKVMQDGRSTYYSESVSVEVKDPFLTTGASLTHYYGNGGLVTFPETLDVTEIGNFAFANFEYVLKTEEELAFDDAETSKQWYIGDSTITKVIIPEGIEKIGAYAFANLTGLEEIVLPSTLESIEYGAFYGCTSLEKITFSSDNNVKIISHSAFEGCDLQGTLEMPSVCVISDYAFAGNQNLKGFETSDVLLSVGEYAFAGCKELKDVTVTAQKVKYGAYAFTGCEKLESFYVNAAVLPEGMFYECTALKAVTVGPDVKDIGEFAFRDTSVDSYEVVEGSETYKVQKASYILSADEKTLIAVSATAADGFTAANIGGAEVTGIAKGAFSHNTKITSVDLPQVTAIGDYAFGSAQTIVSVNLGTLESIGEYAFFETGITQLPAFNKDTKIGRYAFAFTDITAVTIPDGMTVGEGVFSECASLASVTVGNDVVLGKYAFGMNKDLTFRVENYDEEDSKRFYYVFSSGLTELTIGKNVHIGENAFAFHASLETVTLGENAVLDKMAFYNCDSLKNIDLSAVKSIGDYALSGDVYYTCMDDSMSIPAVSKEGMYVYTYHGPDIARADLLKAESIGEYAFAYCREMTDVVLNDAITEIPQYAFAGCVNLKNIDLSKITSVGEYAFIEDAALENADMPVVQTIGDYAFVYCKGLTRISLNTEAVQIGEGAFSYCEKLADVVNMSGVESLDKYAFAYTAIVGADLTGAESIGDHAFIKEDFADFAVTLGENLKTLGDNPFAMCKVAPFAKTEESSFNGTTHTQTILTYDISDTVRVVDGSLYCKVDNGGYELITYAGTDPVDAHIAEETVRISSYAFAGSDVQMITLPYTTTSVGHKAFYRCPSLNTVVFGSFYAPILEESFDPAYYESFEHIPGTGEFGSYTDYDGTDVTVVGAGILPYYMWNATDGMYSSVFYGANFVDYVGYVDNKLTMVRPANGQQYDSYIMSEYFDLAIDGTKAPDKVTVAAINAIKAIPERVAYTDKPLVDAARAAYDKIATVEQQAQVMNYADLISAEQRITALTPTEEPAEETPVEEEPKSNGWIIFVIAGVLAVAAAAGYVFLRKYDFLKKIKAATGNAVRKCNFFKKAETAEEITDEPEIHSCDEAEEQPESVVEASEEVAEDTADDQTDTQ